MMPEQGLESYYIEAIKAKFKEKMRGEQEAHKLVLVEIHALNARIGAARDLVMDGNFDAADYKEVKKQCEKKIKALENELPVVDFSTRNIENEVMVCISNLKTAFADYLNGNVAKHRSIIRSYYPNNLIYQAGKVRTARINDIAYAIGVINKELRDKKKRTKSRNLEFVLYGGSYWVRTSDPLLVRQILYCY
jgi:site-specific DNA recombinase